LASVSSPMAGEVSSAPRSRARNGPLLRPNIAESREVTGCDGDDWRQGCVIGTFVSLLPTIHAIVVGSIGGAMMIGVDPVVSGESVSSTPITGIVAVLDGTEHCTTAPTTPLVDGAIR